YSSCCFDCIIGFNNSYDQKTYEPAKHDLRFIIRKMETTVVLELHYKIQFLLLSLNFRFFYQDACLKSTSFFLCKWEKIYYVFDVPHLLKSTRNNFYKYKFQLSCYGLRDIYNRYLRDIK
ncbi:Uncharacterized protein FWK35_00032185, partial [Aphis craccivora]